MCVSVHVCAGLVQVWMFDFMYLHLCQMKTTDHNNETVTNTLDTKYITTSLSQFKDG